jgi:hypothetical protein
LIFVPGDREEDGLAAHGVGSVLRAGARGETHAPPFTVRVLEEVGVADSLEVFLGVAVREKGVSFVSSVRAGDVFGARDGDGMVSSGSSLGDQEVIPAVLLVDMGSLGPDTTGAVPYVYGSASLAGVEVELLNDHAVGGDIDLAIIVPEQVGVDLGRVEVDCTAPGGFIVGIGGPEEDARLLA